jgi:hypothetical protein
MVAVAGIFWRMTIQGYWALRRQVRASQLA